MNKKSFSISEIKSSGLNNETIFKQTQVFGRNALIGKKPPSDFEFIINQFKNPLVLVLLIAAFITAVIGDFTDAFVISLAIFINTILGFVQERKAFKSLDSLKKVVTHETWVIRNYEKIKIEVNNLVPGDIVILYEGDKIPADGIVIEDNDLLIDEAILTGESLPVTKNIFQTKISSETLEEFISQITNKENAKSDTSLFMGTTVVGGSGRIFVTKIGMKTEIGKIATHLEENRETKTPLEKKLDHLARLITIGIIILSIIIFIIGILLNQDPVEMFTTAVALAVAAIPEGLVVGLTAILAIGMHRILKRKGLVKSLLAAETLGSVTTVCVDKTGTLTEGKMKVIETELIDELLAYKASTLANDLKDPIELARWQWALKISKNNKKLVSPEELVIEHKRDAVIPFSVERRFLASRNNNQIFLSGAPEEMLLRSNVSTKEINYFQNLIENWANKGRRLIGFSYIECKSEEEAKKLFIKLKKDSVDKSKITWLGLMAFDDPIRTSVKSSIKKTQQAGVKVKVITGDFRTTALAVMRKIGFDIKFDEIIEGHELDKMSDIELKNIVNKVVLFARTKPSQKLRIVKALKDNGEIVGMMGDGVNDAPALAISDIGIVVEDASEVAKDAADLILLDSNMQTITASIEEGRSMLENLKKVALYLLSDSFSEILIVMFGLFLGWPTTISAVQILWINLIDDGLPNLALTIDPKDKNLLKRKPLSPKTRLIDQEMLILIIIISLSTAISCIIIFYLYWQQRGLDVARTMIFAVLSIDSLLYVFSCRSLDKNIWHDSILKNKVLVLACGFGILATILSVHLLPLQRLLGTISLGITDWIIVFGTSLGVMATIEAFKWFYNRFTS
ncbi:MAG: HAD-IC family P-type ATPase [Pseudomonadales bacterium]|nr:HAD-IC family P-type ATPase [Pseudomonadales bacterium]